MKQPFLRSARRKLRLGVLAGGESLEHAVSVASAREVIRALDPSRYDVRPIYISREGQWQLTTGERFLEATADDHPNEVGSLPVRLAKDRGVEQALNGGEPLDLIFIAVHGGYGEDGRIQGLLECFKMPYTGSGVAASALCMDKLRLKEILQYHGIETPAWVATNRDAYRADPDGFARAVAETLGFPCYLKIPRSGSSLGVYRIESASELDAAARDASNLDPRFFVERGITGRELTCAVLGNSGDALTPLPVIEIRPRSAAFFDYCAKYTPGASEEICPAPIPAEIAGQVQALAVRLHDLAGCDGMSRIDMILDEDDRLYVLEINTIPGLTSTSLLPQAARAAGTDFPALIEKIVELAMSRFERDSI